MQQLAAVEAGLVSVHKADFPPAEREIADSPEPVDEAAIRRQAMAEALAGISLFAFGKREQARRRALAVTDDRVRAERETRSRAQAEAQAHLDEEWRLLQANDPAAVLEALEAAFEDNQAPAVPIDCTGDSVAIVMLYPSADQIPEQKAALTPTGRPTVHKRSQTERNALHVRSMASNILATVREAFAVAPGVNRVVVLTVEKSDAVGGIAMLRAVAATGFDRDQMERFNWQRLEPFATVEAANPCLMTRRGRTGELSPLDLTHEPDIATVLVTCAAMLNVQVDPRVRIPPGTAPHLPEYDDEPPDDRPTGHPGDKPHAAPARRVAVLPDPSANPSSPPPPGAWSRFRRSPWWVQVIAWLLISPVVASWWCWRRPWPVWGRLVAIGLIVLATLTLTGSFGGSNTSNTKAAAPGDAPGATAPAATQPSTTIAPPTPNKKKPKPRVQAEASADVFNPIEQDGYRDTVRVYFRTPTIDVDSVRVVNARGRVIRSVKLGRLAANRAHSWQWDGRTTQGAVAPPGTYEIRIVARHAGHATSAPAVTVHLRPLAPRVGHVGVSPTPFYPIEQDGYRDTATLTFTTNTNSHDTIRVRSPHGRIIRTVDLGTLAAHTQHTWTWDGRNAAGQVGTPGTYHIQIVSRYYGLFATSQSQAVAIKRKSTTTSSNCTPGYSPCLIYHGGADYDCAGGSGNGPYYTAPGVVYTVTGSDPYGLDANGNGLGCE